MRLQNKYIHRILTVFTAFVIVSGAVLLWRGVVSVDWLASFGYRGIFVFSLVNSVSPIAGPSQIATFLIASKLNPLLVGIAGGVGGSIGELSGYLFGFFLRGSLSRDADVKLKRFTDRRFVRISKQRSFVPLFVLAAIPNPFFDPVSAVAGSLRIAFAKYFAPVLLGRTLRHVIIAYAGFYAISGDLRFLATGTTMTPLIDSLPFITVLILIALAAWLVRYFAESDPDPLILNFTFFAAAGQAILTRELMKVMDPGWAMGWTLLALVFVLFQIAVVRNHADITLERYKKVLSKHKQVECTVDDINRWATALVHITGRDFSPPAFSLAGKRKKEALSVLPKSLFKVADEEITKVADEEITLASLAIPEPLRRWRWWAYVILCIASWAIFLRCIVAWRAHK